MTDPFEYQTPNEITAPKYAAIRAAEAACTAAFNDIFKTDEWNTGVTDRAAAYATISDATRTLHREIGLHAPASADRIAAERCCRLARMAANEAAATGSNDCIRQAYDNLRAARWQACAAVALADS